MEVGDEDSIPIRKHGLGKALCQEAARLFCSDYKKDIAPKPKEKKKMVQNKTREIGRGWTIQGLVSQAKRCWFYSECNWKPLIKGNYIMYPKRSFWLQCSQSGRGWVEELN